VLLLLVGMIIVFRLGWGWWVEKQLNTKLMELRGRGEPGALKEIPYPPLKDAENAWKTWDKALSALNGTVDSPRSSFLEYGDPPYPPAWMNMAAASENANGKAFALARAARGRSLAQFRTGLPVQGDPWLPYLNSLKRLANTLADAAEYAHFRLGDGDEAVERELDLMHLAGTVRQDDFFVSQLVAISIESLACRSTQAIAPELAANESPKARPQREKKIRQLIDVLLDERLAREGIERSIRVERLMLMDYYQQRGTRVWCIRPLNEREIVRMLDGSEVAGDAARCENFDNALEVLKKSRLENTSAISALLPRIVSAQASVPRYSRWFENNWIKTDAFLERQFRVIAERRLTAMGLACQMYRAEKGKWPAKLDDLRPDFVAEVAKDPFHADGRQIGYRVIKGGLPGGGDRPVLYFDPGGPDVGVKAQAMYYWISNPPGSHFAWPVRQYRDLARYVVAKESSKAVDGNPDQADAPGKKSKIENEAQKP